MGLTLWTIYMKAFMRVCGHLERCTERNVFQTSWWGEPRYLIHCTDWAVDCIIVGSRLDSGQ
jgi:hypothetical protein